ncbi:MAG: cobalamin B12-binding domain-containing protein [Deltaproteobacteria bacterium]|nr:MAG: cobalamin B12-binding domain-containing protein [Deltaproteobacteria bacterium]
MSRRHLRVLVAKPGLDGHDRGAKVVARGLRDAGMEVIYTGLHKTPSQIVRTAVDEDVQVVGLSILSGAHNRLLPEVVKGLKAEGMGDVLIIAGGIIPAADEQGLLAAGVSKVFNPGTPIAEIVAFIEENAPDPLA